MRQLCQHKPGIVPEGADRNNLLGGWVRAYVISGGESDRLLAQSPTLLQTIAYLEALPEPPEELLDKLFSLIVASDQDFSGDNSKFWIV